MSDATRASGLEHERIDDPQHAAAAKQEHCHRREDRFKIKRERDDRTDRNHDERQKKKESSLLDPASLRRVDTSH